MEDEAQSTRRESGRHEEKRRIIGKEEGHAELPWFKAPTFEKKTGSLLGYKKRSANLLTGHIHLSIFCQPLR